jgi:hypothetical protein
VPSPARAAPRIHGNHSAGGGDEDTKGCGHHVEPLGDVLVDDVQSTTAAAACLVLDVDDLLDPLQMSGKAPAVSLGEGVFCEFLLRSDAASQRREAVRNLIF